MATSVVRASIKSDAIKPHEITAVILAGGRGSRMGGIDKGLQHFNGVPLALHALNRLRSQVGDVMINANRNLGTYETFGVPVWPDKPQSGHPSDEPYPGPLAGFMVGLEHCKTPYLLTLPCDTPLFPVDLVERLSHALVAQSADFAIASAPEQGQIRAQPVFCLMATSVLPSLQHFTSSGGRKVAAWLAQHSVAEATFNLLGDDTKAFCNANTLAELHQLQSRH